MKKEYRKPEMAVYEIHNQQLLDSSLSMSRTAPGDNNEDIY